MRPIIFFPVFLLLFIFIEPATPLLVFLLHLHTLIGPTTLLSIFCWMSSCSTFILMWPITLLPIFLLYLHIRPVTLSCLSSYTFILYSWSLKTHLPVLFYLQTHGIYRTLACLLVTYSYTFILMSL
jgi:hypothetical protein